MKAAVVGLGQFGGAAARALARSGIETIAIDIEMGPVEAIKDQVALAVATDATSRANLEAHGVADADVLIAGIGADFEAQILVVVHAKQLGIERVVARAASDVHARVLHAVGADEVVRPEEEAASNVVLRLVVPAAEGRIQVAKGVYVVHAPFPEGMVGRTLRDQAADLVERHRIHLIGILRPSPKGGEDALVEPDTRIASGDRMLLAGTEAELAGLRDREG